MSEVLAQLEKKGGEATDNRFAILSCTQRTYGNVGMFDDGVFTRLYYNNTGLTSDYCKVVPTQTVGVVTATLYKDCYISGLLNDTSYTKELRAAGTTISSNNSTSTLLMIYPAE